MEIARNEGTTPLDVVIDIQRHGGAQAISFGMSEADVRDVMRHDFVATASDGSAHVPNSGDQPTPPRAYGTFPRKIRYALDDKVITLEQAVRSCSGNFPAEIPPPGRPRRGPAGHVSPTWSSSRSPKTFRDAATFDHPTRYAPGVKHLFVNGVAVIARGKAPRKKFTPAARPPAARRKTARPTSDPDGRPDLDGRSRAPVGRGALVAGGNGDRRGRIDGDRGGPENGSAGPNVRVIDRPGTFGMPGLIDAHAIT